MNNPIYRNVRQLLDQYGNKINSDNRLLVAYWSIFDKVVIDKNSFDTKSFLEKATNSRSILDAKMLIEEMRKEGI